VDEQVAALNCPYCASAMSLRVDLAAGQRQFLTGDCRACGRCVEVEVDIDADGAVNCVAKRSGEG